MGRSYWWLAHQPLKLNRSEVWEKSKDLLRKAIDLDSNNGWAYAEMAVVISNYDWDSTATRKSLDKAILLMPNDRNAYIHYFFHEFRLGHCEKIRWIIEAEKRFDPWLERQFNNRNICLLACQNNYPEIVNLANRYWDENVDPTTSSFIFDAYLHEGQFDKASVIVNYFKGIDKMTYYLFKALLTAKEGKKNITQQMIDSLNLLSKKEYVPKTYYASIYAALDNREQMYNYLEAGLKEREKELHDVNWYSVFNPYKTEPRFKEIIRRMWIPLEGR